jgi:hypothetical protein
VDAALLVHAVTALTSMTANALAASRPRTALLCAACPVLATISNPGLVTDAAPGVARAFSHNLVKISTLAS